MQESTRKNQKRDSGFQQRTTEVLETQNAALERLEKKLDAPILNGGYDRLVEKVEAVEAITDTLHKAILDPEKGLYGTVKHHDKWIAVVNKVIWAATVFVATGTIGILGKLIYELFTGHIHYTP